MLKELSLNNHLLEDLDQMLRYIKFMKDLVIKKSEIGLEYIVGCIIIE